MHIEELLGGPLALFCLGCSRLWLQIILQWEEIELYFCLISVRPNQKKRAIFSFPHMLQCTGSGPLWGNEVVLWHDEEIRHIITCVLLLHLLCQRLLHNVKHSKTRRHGGFEEKSVGNEFLFPVCGHIWDITWRVMILHGEQQHLCCHALHPPIASLYRHVHWMPMCSLPRCFFSGMPFIPCFM